MRRRTRLDDYQTRYDWDLIIDASQNSERAAYGAGVRQPHNHAPASDLIVDQTAVSNRGTWQGAQGGIRFHGDDYYPFDEWVEDLQAFTVFAVVDNVDLSAGDSSIFKHGNAANNTPKVAAVYRDNLPDFSLPATDSDGNQAFSFISLSNNSERKILVARFSASTSPVASVWATDDGAVLSDNEDINFTGDFIPDSGERGAFVGNPSGPPVFSMLDYGFAYDYFATTDIENEIIPSLKRKWDIR